VVAELASLDDVVPFSPGLLHRVGELVGGAEVSCTELGFMFTPNGREFDERDTFVLDVLRPHLHARHHRACSEGAALDTRLARLTRRQLEILEQVAVGATDAEVGTTLGIAATTVKKHLERVYERLDVHTRTAATAVFLSRRG
jgi:DNA-binding CsgD family transcriptional regulator